MQQDVLDDALEAVERYAERPEEMLNLVALGTKAKIHLLRGDLDTAGATLERADALLRRLSERSGEVIDAVAEISRPFVYKVLPDLLGLPQKGREHVTRFGHMVWATLGPQNELFQEAMEDVGPVIEALVDRGVEVGRRFAALPMHLRVTIGTEADMRRFGEALRAVLAGQPARNAVLRSRRLSEPRA